VGGGVSRYDGIHFTTFTTKQGLPENDIEGILEDKKGNIWFGHVTAGVTRYDGTSFTTFTKEQGMANNEIFNIIEDKKGNLWFATNGAGVIRFDGNSFTTFTTKQGLAHNVVPCIVEDMTGNLWFGTMGGGVSRYDGTSFTNFTTSHGLAENNVNSIIQDDNGGLWFGTNKGFSNLKFRDQKRENNSAQMTEAGLLNENNEQLKNYESVWGIYNIETGYPVKDLAFNVCRSKWGLPNGNRKDVGVIWGGCGDGKVIRFDPSALNKNTEPAVVFIRSVKIDEQTINWYGLGKIKNDSELISQQEVAVFGNLLSANVRDSLQKKFRDIQFDSITPYFSLPQNLVLPYRHNRVSFDFGAIETNRNFMVRYQFILEGYDKEWSPVTEKSSATFGNISEGKYTFKLKARSPEGIWGDLISYSFKVLPPWWRTWWFRSITAISILFLLYGIYRWRTAVLRNHKKKLEKTIKERTAEVVKEKSEVEKRNVIIQKEKEKSDELLLNILPSEVADELKEKGYTTAKAFDEVTILFSDIKDFTQIAEKMTAQELVQEINIYFSVFDGIIQNYKLEKIKTIGDAYIAAGGLPEKNYATAQDVIEAAIAMQQSVEKLKQERVSSNKPYFELRIGIHTGPVVAGVVGIKKFQYDIWGDSVNLAARMEQSGVPGRINISQQTYELVKEQFTCVHRGKIGAKNKGEIDMYFVE